MLRLSSLGTPIALKEENLFVAMNYGLEDENKLVTKRTDGDEVGMLGVGMTGMEDKPDSQDMSD